MGQGVPASSVRPPASGSAVWQTGSPHVEYHRSAGPPELSEPPPDELPLADPSELDVVDESASPPCPADEVLHPITRAMPPRSLFANGRREGDLGSHSWFLEYRTRTFEEVS